MPKDRYCNFMSLPRNRPWPIAAHSAVRARHSKFWHEVAGGGTPWRTHFRPVSQGFSGARRERAKLSAAPARTCGFRCGKMPVAPMLLQPQKSGGRVQPNFPPTPNPQPLAHLFDPPNRHARRHWSLGMRSGASSGPALCNSCDGGCTSPGLCPSSALVVLRRPAGGSAAHPVVARPSALRACFFLNERDGSRLHHPSFTADALAHTSGRNSE